MTWMYGWFLQIIHSAPRRHALMEPVMTTLNTAMGCPTAEMAPMNSTAVSRREQNWFLILSILSIYASKISPFNSQCQRVKKRSIYLIKTTFIFLPPRLSFDFSATQHCPLHQFECANGFCVLHSLVCDHWDDCGDNSDEQGCGEDTSADSDEGFWVVVVCLGFFCWSLSLTTWSHPIPLVYFILNLKLFSVVIWYQYFVNRPIVHKGKKKVPCYLFRIHLSNICSQ